MSTTSRKNLRTTDIIAEIFGEATIEVLEGASGASIYFSPTIQKIPAIHLKPDVGCFVQFSGDYSGLMIINFTREAAMEYYRKSLLFMGMPEEELAIDHTSDEVVDSIGEAVNQLIGKARQKIQERFGLSAHNNQPKAICILDSVLLSIDNLAMHRNHCRRLSFKISESASFHIELFFEETEFITLHPERLKVNSPEETSPEIDFEALVATANLDS